MECLHKLGLRIPRLRSAAITLCTFQTKLINLSTLFSNADCLIPFFMSAWLLGCSVLKLLPLFVCLFFSLMFLPSWVSGLVPVWVVWAVLAELGAMVLRAFCGRHGKFLGLSGCEARKTLSMGQEGENKLSINDISKRRGYMPCWAACLHWSCITQV